MDHALAGTGQAYFCHGDPRVEVWYADAVL